MIKQQILLLLIISCINIKATFLQENINENSLTFEESIRKFSRSNLIAIALACEKHEVEVNKIPKFGGLHDYVNTLQDEDIIKIIFKYTVQFPELYNIETLKKKANISDNTPEPEDFKLYLNTLNRSKIIDIALVGEKFDRKKQGREKFLGGLHDYINSLKNEEIVEIIIKFCDKYPELKENKKIVKLSERNILSLDDIRDSLKDKKKEELVHLALVVDNYDRDNSAKIRFGGIHDYVNSLSEKKLVDFIVSVCDKWFELRGEGFIMDLVAKNKTNLGVSIFGGIEDYLHNFDLEELKRMAIAGEFYDRQIRKVTLLGGLHDYINSLSKERVMEIIMSYLKIYPELRTQGKLEELAKIPKSGYSEMLKDLSKDDLIKACLNLESFDKINRNTRIMGGIHDYVRNLSIEEMITYIRRLGEYYPEIRFRNTFDRIALKLVK